MKWQIGVTTVPQRYETTLLKTLTSLRAGGFDDIRLFADGHNSHPALEHPVSYRGERIGPWGNWLLGLQELHLREPHADRYLMCQDDVVCVKNLRSYLEKSTVKNNKDVPNCYWNCFTFERNEQAIAGKPIGWHEASTIVGGGTKQTGKGALMLMFTLRGVELLLGHTSIVNKCRGSRPKTNIDGGIVQAMNAMGYREMVHNPSLTDHIGDVSVIAGSGDDPCPHGPWPKCQSFPGETFEAAW